MMETVFTHDMAPTTNPTATEAPAMSIFPTTVSASDAAEAAAKVERRLVEGYRLTGRVAIRSERHMLWTVEVEGSGDKNGLWVNLTSYGINPGEELGSVWQTVPGIGCAA